ncbi:MAG: branched-chain amino acid ABC transporter permease [Deltaproteobacteria bacterium]|jgi:branched-chain amino acid transport system permease protein|nr:branched-chain amino acid ABC transporter permease [Syntrophaceae bacterium]
MVNDNTNTTKLQELHAPPKPVVVYGTIFVLLFLPLVLSTPLATEILIWAIFGMGFNLLLGYTGVLSFGHAAYFGLGAYSSGLAFRYLDASLPVGIAAGVLAPMLLACFIGALAIRKRGVYFAMISLAFAQMLYFLALSPLKHITRGEDGLTHIPAMAIFSFSLGKPLPLYYFVLVVTGVMLFVTWRILQSPFGKLLQAFRENEERAKACGYNTTMVKFWSLVISAFYAGLAGSLNTVYLGYVPLTTLFWLTSGTMVMMTILGGKGTFLGPLVGVGVFLFLQNTISLITPRWELFVGAIFVAIILLFPGGIMGTLEEKMMAYRMKRASK